MNAEAPRETPTRWVEGMTFHSSDPQVRIEVADSLHFIGRFQFDISNLADVDSFYFADATAGPYTRRLAFHFETQRPGRDFTYRFPAEPLVRLGEFDYYHDAFFGPQARLVAENPKADFSKVENFLQSQTLELWEDAMWHRFMRTLDESRRSELLILYHEDLRNVETPSADLSAEGAKADQWPKIAKELRLRALSSFRVTEG
ncbi:MAG: hypothetical protein HOM68_14610 [Gemmatimonadetes bacterium]|jgi:hypothetical protein|nr:hypothetical protein [Gemmatimonadota bacterium]MBT4611058.1 hypothetical protein [Gemmatimonadota bacterium]MBT5057773.1 hypothetical protein [Gemmatimonadota bacterium]MBT5141315.1 hypothetical protein [Gemmatimonadota bacterium]MBT5590396.1 hypothetical protein [Gemmatimonadota bacterium]